MIVKLLIIYLSVINYQIVTNAYPSFNKISDKNGLTANWDTNTGTTPQTQSRRSSTGKIHNLKTQLMHVTTVTPKPYSIELNDIFISVKTTKNNHNTRLNLILQTWFELAKEQTWFFTDYEDQEYRHKTNGHLINTNCSIGHHRSALTCKMSYELDAFLASMKKWFCHFDDDNYVNVPKLIELLNKYNSNVEWYLGKPSVASPIEINLEYKNSMFKEKTVKFWFATGGAGFCISRSLALRMAPIVGGGKLISVSERIGFPDDVTIGFVIEHYLQVPLTVIDRFHSHLEPLEHIKADVFSEQVSLSYGDNQNQWNVIKLDGFGRNVDPSRFLSLHCHLLQYNSIQCISLASSGLR